MSKQSSIEWLVTELNQMIDSIPLSKWDKIADIIQQAKQMHKQEIESAFNNGMRNSEDWFTDGKTEESEQYYQETYGGNKEIL